MVVMVSMERQEKMLSSTNIPREHSKEIEDSMLSSNLNIFVEREKKLSKFYLRGVRGDRGDRGPKGQRGIEPEMLLDKRGYKGDVGPKGQTGFRGNKGIITIFL